MNTAQKTDRIILVVLAFLLLLIVVRQFLPSRSTETTDNQTTGLVTYEDYNGKPIGIMSGTNLDGDPLSLTILTHMVSQTAFTYDQSNHVHVTL